MYKWIFTGNDNYGNYFFYIVHASNKQLAINAGMQELRKDDCYRFSRDFQCTPYFGG